MMATCGILKAFTARAAIGVGGGQGVLGVCQGSQGRFHKMSWPCG